MNRRALRVLAGLGWFFLAGAITWAISWLAQYICTLTIAGQHLDVTSTATNRLALVTVITAFVVAAAIFVGILIGDGLLVAVLIFCFSSVIVGIIAWVGSNSFPGTPVSTLAAQILYGIGTLAWGAALWYVFLADVSKEVIQANGD